MTKLYEAHMVIRIRVEADSPGEARREAQKIAAAVRDGLPTGASSVIPLASVNIAQI